jgi:opacity protein-like surface antigen
MKSIFAALCCASIFTPLPTLAAASFNGVILGIDGGIIQLDAAVKHNSYFLLPIPAASFETILTNGPSTRLTDITPTAGLIIGYAFSCMDSWLIGVEGRGNIGKTKIEQNSPLRNVTGPAQTNIAIGATAEMSHQFGVLAKLGYHLGEDTLLYGLIGPQWAKFSSNFTNSFVNGDTPFSSGLNSANSQYEAGYVLGLGIEQLIGPCWSFGLEYNFTNYGALDTSYANSQFIFQGTLVSTSENEMMPNLHAKSNAMMLRLTYYYPSLA